MVMTKGNMQHTDALLMGKYSMLSKKSFEQIDMIVRLT